ncbi:MAG: TonB-dependent receptor [Candidatus Azobacteroides sp.]|nr:TonB-dependent receptor [Candidatus Azobacteroides sp.]
MKIKLYCTLFSITLLLCAGSLSLFSQSITLKGKVIDEKTNEFLEFANVTLLKPDSSFVNGSQSDNKGEFILSDIAPGDYLLSVSFLGYRTGIIKLDNLSISVDLDKIYLQQDAQLLNEVVVQGSGRINKVDRQIILPTQIQVKSSNSGFELLNNLMIPGLRADPIQNTITAVGGGNVQVRINDVIASVTQIKALRPTNVLRVEYIDDPGVRYGDENVNAVINFIVKQTESGVSINADLQNAAYVGFANDLLSLRANHKKSEFGLDYFLSWRNYKKRYSDSEERYIYPTTEIQRNMNGVEQPFGYLDHSIEASYNLTEPDKYVFNVVFKDYISNSPNNDFAYLINYNDPGMPPVNSRLHAAMNSNTPSIDLYYHLQLPKKQSIAFNTVGTIISSDYDRSYFEYHDVETGPTYAYSTDGKKYSFIGEGVYDKEFKPFKLTSGLKYSQSYTENVYTGSTNTTTNLHNSSLYIYGQLQGKLDKINYLIGAGLSRSGFKETTDEYTFYTFQPNVSLSYSFLKTSFLRYRFSIVPLLPSLSALSDVRQDLEDFRVSVGNPDLKPYRRYRNSIFYQFKKNLITGTLTETYDYYRKPIMENVFREDSNDKSTFVYTYNNQKTLNNSDTDSGIVK